MNFIMILFLCFIRLFGENSNALSTLEEKRWRQYGEKFNGICRGKAKYEVLG